MSETSKNSAANIAIVRWSKILMVAGIGIIAIPLAIEYTLRIARPNGPVFPTGIAIFPTGLIVLFVGAMLLAFAAMKPYAGQEKLDTAKIIMASGLAIIVLQLVLDYMLRFMNVSKEPAIFPLGLLVLAVGAILLAFTTYRATPKPDSGEEGSDHG